jgi:hypothetical protein
MAWRDGVDEEANLLAAAQLEGRQQPRRLAQRPDFSGRTESKDLDTESFDELGSLVVWQRTYMASPFIGAGEAYAVFGTGWRTGKLELPLMARVLCRAALRPAVGWKTPACFIRLGVAWRGGVMPKQRDDYCCRLACSARGFCIRSCVRIYTTASRASGRTSSLSVIVKC